MRDDLEALLKTLIARSDGGIDIDAFAEAVLPYAPTPEELDELMTALEKNNITVIARAGGEGEDHLARVLAAARELRVSLGRVPTPPEIARHTGLDLADVRHALALGRVMGR